MQQLAVRPIEPDDVDRLERMFYRLSPETVYLRFFTPVKKPRRSVLEHLATVDHDHRDALVALDGDEIVGVARYDRLRDDPTAAEVAVLIEDGWQHNGVATMLLNDLARAAKRRGITRFTASVLGENQRVLRLARSLNPQMRTRWADGELAVDLPLVAA